MTAIVIGLNSYASVADADALLGSSLRAAANWDLVSPEDKTLALLTAFRLLELQTWQGAQAGLSNVSTAAINTPSDSYLVGEVLTVVGGTGVAAIFEVLSIDGLGGITAVTLLNTGEYSAVPPNPVAVTSSNSAGALLDLSIVAQQTQWPRTGVRDRYGNPVDPTTVPANIVAAQIQLAYELTQDPSLETQRNLDSNISSVHAGSVGVDFFAPQKFQGRFPWVVWELVQEFISGPGLVAPVATGTGGESQFIPPRYQPACDTQ